MFDFLKKKVTQFTEKIKDAIEAKKETISQTIQPEQKETLQQPKEAEPKEQQKQPLQPEIEQTEQEDIVEPEPVFEQEIEMPNPAEQTKQPEKKIEHQKRTDDDKRELKAKVGITKKITSIFSGTITISEEDIEKFLEEFELALLEADVESNTAQQIVFGLKKELTGKKISSKQDISESLKTEIKKVLSQIMHTHKINFLQEIGKKKPFIVLFLGPNGAGKTTTIAKIANYLKKHKKSVLLCAADTFRAASIEQLETHAKALELKVIKHTYGSDPAAVAFDAVASAKAKNIDVVLIDSAGRQETNKNLIEELKKLERVAKPDLKIFIGESYAGQSLLSQAAEFDKHIKIDGFCLTKIDADAKGGTAISLLYNLKKPIIFIGTGQHYDDLAEFEPEMIIEKIV